MALFSHFYLICAIFIFQTSPSRQEKNFDSEVQVFFVHSKKLVKTISFLEETPEANVSHDLLSLLSDKLNSDLSLYNDFAVKIKNKAPLKNFVEKL